MVATRHRDYSQDSDAPTAPPVPVPAPLPAPILETLTERRLRWSRLLREAHYHPIIAEVLDEELPKYATSKVIDPTDRVPLIHECALILASAPLVFAAAVDGDLVKRMLTDTNLQQEYQVIQSRAHHQPSIYIHLLADSLGNAPTPIQTLAIADMVQDYLAEQPSAHAWHVDNITRPQVSKEHSDNSFRKYLQSPTTARSAAHIQTLNRYIAGIHARFNESPTTQHTLPLLFPPGECGYSINSPVRLAQHRAHRSSNYTMNLVEDICTYLYRTKQVPQHFTMHQFIIYLIFRPTQAAIAEIFCSGLLQVWVDNGGGFNACPAGRSVSSVKSVGEGTWEEHERWVREGSPVDENMRVQRERAGEWVKALEEEGEGEGREKEKEKEDVVMGGEEEVVESEVGGFPEDEAWALNEFSW